MIWKPRASAFPWAPHATPEPECGLKRTVRWLMSVVNCATFKRRCAMSLTAVRCHADEAKMRFANAAPVTWSRLTDGGQFIEIKKFAKSEYGGRLMNTFYPTNGPQTIGIRRSHFHEPPYGCVERETFSLFSPHCVGRRSAQLDY